MADGGRLQADDRIGGCYAQNIRGVNDYSDRIIQGELADKLVLVTPTGCRRAIRLSAGVFERYLCDEHSCDRISSVL
ncbi:MAG: hypothetical protein AB8B64_07080 [Granulosicoccus sp.]